MKTIFQNIFPIALVILLFTGFSSSVAAQGKSGDSKQQTISLKVFGVCGDCKQRIESTALDVKGVKKAEWDMQSDVLVLIGTKKMSIEKVAAALAKAGHRSELLAADPKGYANLPACCQYDSGVNKH